MAAPLADEAVQHAWRKCNDLWTAAGSPTPYYGKDYLAARDELAAAIRAAERKHRVNTSSDVNTKH